MIYVVARSVKTDRPGCMHVTDSAFGTHAVCGYDLSGASRNYTDAPLLAILCKTCDRILEK